MPIPARVAVVGDYDPAMYTHRAIDEALGHVRELREHALEWKWIATSALATEPDQHLALIDAIWLAPGSPYASLDGALAAVRCARQNGIPFLGVCGGFQHALLEFARNVAGLPDADHAESNPGAATPVIAPLACSLVGKSAPVFLDPTCRTASIYGRWRVVERYHCSYGLNPASPGALNPGAPFPRGARVVRRDPCPLADYRRLYQAVGGPWHWHDRLAWDDDTLRAHLSSPDIAIWELLVGDESAGYFELRRSGNQEIELAYFGLRTAFIGRGLGGSLLTHAVEEAWKLG